MANGRISQTFISFLLILLIAVLIIPRSASADPIMVGISPVIPFTIIAATAALNFAIDFFWLIIGILVLKKISKAKPIYLPATRRQMASLLLKATGWVAILGALIDVIVFYGLSSEMKSLNNIAPINWIFALFFIFLSVYFILGEVFGIKKNAAIIPSALMTGVNLVSWLMILSFTSSSLNLLAGATISIMFLLLAFIAFHMLERARKGQPPEQIMFESNYRFFTKRATLALQLAVIIAFFAITVWSLGYTAY